MTKLRSILFHKVGTEYHDHETCPPLAPNKTFQQQKEHLYYMTHSPYLGIYTMAKFTAPKSPTGACADPIVCFHGNPMTTCNYKWAIQHIP